MRRLPIALAATALVLLLPCAAQATTCVGPPGLGAVDQYCELVPVSGAHGGGTARQRRKTVPAQARVQLQRAGSDGQGVLALAQTAPVTSTKQRRAAARRAGTPQPTSGGSPAARVTDVASSGALDVARSAVLDGPGVSRFLPWALLASALAAAALAFRRRRPS